MSESQQTRRGFLSHLAAAGAVLTGHRAHASPAREDPAGVLLRIGPVRVEISKNRTISTVGYNGEVPGPLIRLREGVPVTMELVNETDEPEFVHWHGLIVPADLDGAPEENSLPVPPHGRLRYRMTPHPSGTRFVHTHAMSMGDLNRSTFTGQYAFTYVEPRSDPGSYDQEYFLATHEWEPHLVQEEAEEDGEPLHEGPHGWEVEYRRFTINGKCLGYGDPLRVKQGQRILFHFLNASATENIQLALPGHRFEVVALDGNAVPHPRPVEVLELGTAERIDAIVAMEKPGVWVLGTPKDRDRKRGMGIVIEYANHRGKPRWIAPVRKPWDYTLFGEAPAVPHAAQNIRLLFGQIKGGASGFEEWTINGRQFDPQDKPVALSRGTRYRLIFDNQTEDAHPVHLHRMNFELTNVYGVPTGGLMKDVVLIRPFQKIEADVMPSLEGLALFHCHQQLHMDHGFKMMFEVI